MGTKSRRKGNRVELEILHALEDEGIAVEKKSGMYISGNDLRIADEFQCEVKARSNGAGFTLLRRWLGDNDMLALREDRAKPVWVVPHGVFLKLLKGYLRS